MSFVLMFKFDALGKSRERYPQDVTIRRLWNVSPKKRKTIKQLTLSCIRQTFGETKLKILHRKYICTRNSKLTSWRHVKDITLQTSFKDVFRACI